MRQLLLSLATLFLILAAPVWADKGTSDIHAYAADSVAIVIGSPISFSARDGIAELKVERWIKQPPPTTRPAPDPPILTLKGFMSKEDFHRLQEKGRFFVFVLPGNQTGPVVRIDEQGNPEHPGLIGPRAAGELEAQVRRVLSADYRRELVALLQNGRAATFDRAQAAQRLGSLRAHHAWDALEAEAVKPGTDEGSSISRETLRALARLDPARTTPICLKLVHMGANEYQVGIAAWLLAGQIKGVRKQLGA